jgi:antitoxin (DNA-binding transcriptional repressor) of toxin-antitoxin stability system
MVARREVGTIGVHELHERTDDVLRRVKGGEIVEVADDETIIARIVPAETSMDLQALEEWWGQVDQLAEEIGRSWPEGVSAADAVAEQRRSL